MKKQLDSVKKFHETYKIGFSNSPLANLGSKKNSLRFNLMDEENKENLEAPNNNDLIDDNNHIFYVFEHQQIHQENVPP